MKHKIIFSVLTGLCTVLLFAIPSYNRFNKEPIPSSPLSEHAYTQNSFLVGKKNIACKYYDEKDFLKSVSTAQSIHTPAGEIKGGIVPHHLLASGLISSFFKTLSVEQPEIIVVIAPNHKGLGVNKVHTGNWDWQTPFGILEADQETISVLADSKTADMNFDLLESDHSIAGLVPYIKYYMPDSKIIPILLHGNYSLKEAQQLGQNLQKKLENKKTLILASVDFSHYLPLEEADEMDKVSIQAIENRNLNLIQHLSNDYMDSPASIITLLSAMDIAGVDEMEVLGHSNSDRIADTKSGNTTSYFTIVFYKVTT
ncbi:AmmeMemoRadiSam system protein B [Petroclostridium sp. X23]|uniref:AmmeMemoRadiSam system protein B n=1 Tax=Petroclostridium sp. X23 TaxID=3045146 RepID=UPI0024ADF54D|nr:AmmeMemoRadiSam system protein B [Petroclostridium sp. X23]WHH57136.1 AmmeMemoRadiSam system protein B [Petroclostridium sp. X23]